MVGRIRICLFSAVPLSQGSGDHELPLAGKQPTAERFAAARPRLLNATRQEVSR
jgi:hypothetical protein